MICVHNAQHLYNICMFASLLCIATIFIFQRIVVHIIVADFVEGCTHYLVWAESVPSKQNMVLWYAGPGWL